ncbi:MAG: amphi-Trp domain-containing protein [Phycisphaerales bacterium]|nr:amphi-Trp domain-containing protein [Phycisphaerales bacterium]
MASDELRVRSAMDPVRAAQYLQAIVNGLRSGQLRVEHGDEEITLAPHGELRVSVKARRKREKESVSVKMSWEAVAEETHEEEAPENDGELRIMAGAPTA